MHGCTEGTEIQVVNDAGCRRSQIEHYYGKDLSRSEIIYFRKRLSACIFDQMALMQKSIEGF